ncbi:MAG: hypothetical protein LBU11_01405 [Zoogloeaceae bacterium]|jgi:hypothetical protein|nr:hypothetical protein [Zoogloeaceae bacterium]
MRQIRVLSLAAQDMERGRDFYESQQAGLGDLARSKVEETLPSEARAQTLCAYPQPRHCEGRRPVAIQTAFPFALSFQKTEPLSGLPRRYAPENDEGGGERTGFPPLWIAPLGDYFLDSLFADIDALPLYAGVHAWNDTNCRTLPRQHDYRLPSSEHLSVL